MALNKNTDNRWKQKIVVKHEEISTLHMWKKAAVLNYNDPRFNQKQFAQEVPKATKTSKEAKNKKNTSVRRHEETATSAVLSEALFGRKS